jgi:hypothetical protein
MRHIFNLVYVLTYAPMVKCADAYCSWMLTAVNCWTVERGPALTHRMTIFAATVRYEYYYIFQFLSSGS